MTIGEITEKFLPDETSVRLMTDFFNVFGDGTRLKILSLLSISELNVGEITSLLNANQSTVSHQLKIMKDKNIVSSRREKKTVVYFIDNRYVSEIMLTCALAIN